MSIVEWVGRERKVLDENLYIGFIYSIYSQVPLQRGPIYHDITAMTVAEHQLDQKLTKRTHSSP